MCPSIQNCRVVVFALLCIFCALFSTSLISSFSKSACQVVLVIITSRGCDRVGVGASAISVKLVVCFHIAIVLLVFRDELLYLEELVFTH